jgi:MoaA/NifB/PqqE/SkfB family radical SAM enzyme
MREWTDEYNAYNTWKILFHIDHLRQIASGEFPPPITADTDVSNACNQDCVYCNSKVFREESGAVLLSKEHLFKIADMYKDWGVLSSCVGGGGEPTVNPALYDFLDRLISNGVEAGLISNGVIMKDNLKGLLVDKARFLGISFDSADPEIYQKMRGKDHLGFVLKNVASIAALKKQRNSNLDLNAKVLIHPLNYNNLYYTAKVCKEAGFNGVQIRPVAIDNVRGKQNEGRFSMKDYLKEINEQIEHIYQDIEDENFKVRAVVHKFADDLGRKITFDKCRATPIQAVFGADGWVYCCFNVRGYEESRICRHYPDPYEVMREWGGERHRWVLDHIDPVNRCIRCTYNRYNEVIEKAILQDNMFYKFP